MIRSDILVCACADFNFSVLTSSSRNAVTWVLRRAQRARRGVSPTVRGCLRGRTGVRKEARIGAVSGISQDCGVYDGRSIEEDGIRKRDSKGGLGRGKTLDNLSARMVEVASGSAVRVCGYVCE